MRPAPLHDTPEPPTIMRAPSLSPALLFTYNAPHETVEWSATNMAPPSIAAMLSTNEIPAQDASEPSDTCTAPPRPVM